MKRQNKKKGCATLCIGGGMGIAYVYRENLEFIFHYFYLKNFLYPIFIKLLFLILVNKYLNNFLIIFEHH